MDLDGQQQSELWSENDAFEKVKLARHPERPYALDYIETIFEGFFELRGDRRFSNDPAIISGFANFHGNPVAIVGQQKGRDTKQRRYRNFAMSKPEGYRKAARIMRLAEKFGRPVISLIDTPGAYPGIDAEERGQAEAIAFNLYVMARLKVPVIAIVIGEGGSGGALAIGVADVVLMLENAIYSVITPEGCAAILWKSSSEAHRAAKALKLTAQDLADLELVDGIVEEPVEGAHAALSETARRLDRMLIQSLEFVKKIDSKDRINRRYRKLRLLGY